MNSEEISVSVKIAEACGWKIEPSAARGGWLWRLAGVIKGSFWWNPEKTPTLEESISAPNCPIPDYLNDLNAMHEAESMCIFGNRKEQKFFDLRNKFRHELWRVVAMVNLYAEEEDMIHATAHQRAEAFLKTIGKWTEQP